MNTVINFQEGSQLFYLRRISPYLAYGREYSFDRKIIFEGYYRNYGLKGWQRVSL